jgi:hypothetical protein
MAPKHKQRLAKLEAPPAPEPEAGVMGRLVCLFYAAEDMPVETAMTILGIKPRRDAEILCLRLLPPGSAPCWEFPGPDTTPRV